jgi:pimeloyl-ACP methyl ester carboxylesterase
MRRESRGMRSPNPYHPLCRGPADAAPADVATWRGAGTYLVSRLTIGAFQALQPLRGARGRYVGDDVGQVERTLQSGEELVWLETTRGERIGLIIRPPTGKQQWIVFFYGIGMTVAGTGPVRRWLGSAGYGVACVEYAGFGISFGSHSEYGCYRSADAAITYLQRQASITVDQVTLIGWSLGSAVAIDLASRRDVRAQVLLSPWTSLLACGIDLARLGKTSFAIGPFDALSRARSIDRQTLVISGTEDALTRPWMADELTKAMGGHARLVSLPGVGHNDMLRSGERLWNVVKEFLNSAANASG